MDQLLNGGGLTIHFWLVIWIAGPIAIVIAALGSRYIAAMITMVLAAVVWLKGLYKKDPELIVMARIESKGLLKELLIDSIKVYLAGFAASTLSLGLLFLIFYIYG